MTYKAILRTAKLKTFGNIGGASSHNMRDRPTHNADDSRSHLNKFFGEKDAVLGVKARIKDLYGDKSPRKNAVLGVETLLAASPEFFQNSTPETIQEWEDESIAWANKFWGKDNVIQVAVHYDERTPHIQIISVPEVDGKLNCREILGGKKKLADMQTSYANAVEGFGIERGLERSKGKHVPPSLNYASLKIEAPEVPKPITMMQYVEKKAFFGLITTHVPVERIVVPYGKDTKQKLTEMSNYHQSSVASKELERRSRDELREARILEASQLRDIDLISVALKLGLDRDKYDKKKYGGVSINAEKGVFNDFGDIQGRGAIDLVMKVNSCDYKNALSWLKSQFSIQDIANSIASRAHNHATEMLEEIKPKKLLMPNIAPSSEKVISYLEGRGIDTAVVKNLIDAGQLYQDHRNNAVFVMGKGAEIVGTGSTKYKRLATGTDKGTAFFTQSENGEKLAVCESAIDAISYTEKTGIKAVSSSGEPSSNFIRTLGRYCVKHGITTIVSAYDNDEAGDNFSESTAYEINHFVSKDLIVERHAPATKDWNEDLILFKNNPAEYEELLKPKPDGSDGGSEGTKISPIDPDDYQLPTP